MSEPRIIRVWGGAGTTKSWCAGQGLAAEKSCWYGEFDIGSFARANFPNPEVFDLHSYKIPLRYRLNLGTASVGEKGGVGTHNIRKIEGMSELCQEITDDLVEALESEQFDRYIFDTETTQWFMAQAGHNQQEQNASGDERKRLDQLHYTEPNRWMESWMRAPRDMGKTLVIICQEKEKFGSAGLMIPDGYKGTGALVDLSMRFFIQNKVAYARIDKTGSGGLDLMDMELESPTFDKITMLIDCADALRNAHLPVPQDYKKLIEMGGKLL